MKYVPGGMFGQFSGSQGNTTASRNKFSSYVRNRVMPADPATSKQLAQRALITGFSNDWRGLSQVQRDGWIALGDQMIRSNSLGQDYTLTGVQAFTSVNMNLDLIGSAAVDDAPILGLPTDVLAITLTASEGGGAIDLAYTNVITAGDFMVVDGSAGVSQGINFVPRSGFKFLQTVDSVALSPADLQAAWEAIYGAHLQGQKIFVQARMINAEGFAGSPSEVSVIVAA